MIRTYQKRPDRVVTALKLCPEHRKQLDQATQGRLKWIGNGRFLLESCFQRLEAHEGGYIVIENHDECPPLGPHRGFHPVVTDVFPILYTHIGQDRFRQRPVLIDAVTYTGDIRPLLALAEDSIHEIKVVKNQVFVTSYESPDGYPIQLGQVLVLGVFRELYVVNPKTLPTKYKYRPLLTLIRNGRRWVRRRIRRRS